MKKVIKAITIVTAALILLSVMAGCGIGSGSKKIDYNELIESFTESSLNTFELTVGDEAAPGASIWTKNKNADTTVYSSDEKVVTVSKYGKVTAVGEGSAYVVITSMDGSMFDVYKYNVYNKAEEANVSNLPQVDGIDVEKEISNFNSTALNTFVMKTGDTHTPTASVWASAGGECYTTDESVVTVADNGNVTATGKGTAYVIIKSSVGTMFEIYKYVVNG